MKNISKILIAVDSFKGSLSSIEAAGIIEKGFKFVSPDLSIKKTPLADGGEGTVEAIVEALNGDYVNIKVKDPLYRDIKAKYGIVQNGKTAVIEMAEASGITLLSDSERDPMTTTTFGTGQLIKYAVAGGCTKIILGIGGSATNDGGLGMAAALGAKFLDSSGKEAGIAAVDLINVAFVDLSELNQLFENIEVTTLCDVNNPLCGETGASAVYGPQKGADEEMVGVLDKRLAHFADVVENQLDRDLRNTPGAGAAGGLGFGAMAFLNSKLAGGTEFLIDLLNIEDSIKASDVVITGEGKIDSQTKYDKLPMGIAKLAKNHDKLSICIAGMFGEGYEEFQDIYFDKMYSIVSDDISESDAMTNADTYLNELSVSIARDLSKFNS